MTEKRFASPQREGSSSPNTTWNLQRYTLMSFLHQHFLSAWNNLTIAQLGSTYNISARSKLSRFFFWLFFQMFLSPFGYCQCPNVVNSRNKEDNKHQRSILVPHWCKHCIVGFNRLLSSLGNRCPTEICQIKVPRRESELSQHPSIQKHNRLHSQQPHCPYLGHGHKR